MKDQHAQFSGILRRAVFGVVTAALVCIPLSAQTPQGKCPPAARADNVQDNYHGTVVVDPYHWLEDQNSPETRAWIEAENSCTESVLRKLPGREELSKRFGQLLKVDTVSAPQERGGRFFYMNRKANQDLSVIYMRRGFNGKEEVLLDPASLSADHTTSAYLGSISEDGKVIAFSIQKGGQDESSIRFMDTDTRKELPDHLPSTRYFGEGFTADKTGFYYSAMTPQGPRVYCHTMGSNGPDQLVFGEGFAPDKIISVFVSDDGKYVIYSAQYGVGGSSRDEIYVQDIKRSRPIIPAIQGIPAKFSGQIINDTLYVTTNWKAPKSRLVAVPLDNTAQDHWKEILPEGSSVLGGVSYLGGKIFATYMIDVVFHIKIFSIDGKPEGEVPMPQMALGGITGRWTSKDAFLSYQSFGIPDTIDRYDIANNKLTHWQKQSMPIESDSFETKQVWYTSKDGTRVPMFIFSKKGIALDGSYPTLLTGYGGFDISSLPMFSDEAVVWAEHGGVYAVANMRGGNEFGEAWHLAGMLDKKQNVFDDFIAAAEYLIANKYTVSQKLAIEGGSNGGLLVGAMMVQRPDLFGAIVCEYPLLDMIRYQNFLVAKWWVPEYGSSDDPKQLPYLMAYSPYQNVKPGTKYPATLFITGDNDTRVAPLHARKMAARTQAAQGGDKPILLLYDTKSGHAGGRPIGKQIEEKTDVLSFLFWQLGVQK